MKRGLSLVLGAVALLLAGFGGWGLFTFGEYGFIGMWALILAGVLGVLALVLFGSARRSG